MAEIISGKIVSQLVRTKLKSEIELLKNTTSSAPGLAVILVGDDAASKVYVKNKHKACVELGINSYEIIMPESTPEEELISKIHELNSDDNVDGILVQLPLPKHINEENVISAISVQKDVDAFHPYNVGKILTGDYTFLPCTPAGIITLLEHYNVDVKGKKCVVIGRSNIVGKPMALLMLEKNATVTICHSKTERLEDEIASADILIVAIGKPEFIKGRMIKPGAVVIDVGINRLEDGRLVGDVDFESTASVASMITPVPGGVGPMTITTLMCNTVTAFKHNHCIDKNN